MTCDDCGKYLTTDEYVEGVCRRCFALIPPEPAPVDERS